MTYGNTYLRCFTVESIDFTIEGEPASKANSRRIVLIHGKPRVIKSAKALAYAKDFERQCPRPATLMDGDLKVTITIFYGSRRPDLDESLILDLMQDRIYKNDRQIKEKEIHWGLDPARPRAHIRVSPVAGGGSGRDQ